MDAVEALALTKKAKARAIVRTYIPNIQRAAEEGLTAYEFGVIGTEAAEALRTLGYTVQGSAAGNMRVSWDSPRE